MFIHLPLFRKMRLAVPRRQTADLHLTLILSVVLGNPVANGAPAGELDASFGENGRLTLGSGNFIYRYASAVAQQPTDGKLLIAAAFDGHMAVLRLQTDGSLDNTFGQNGVAHVAFGPEGASPYGLVLQPDGKIVVAGHAYSGFTTGVPQADFAFARLDTDGTLDATFGDDGLVTIDFGGDYEFAFAIALLPNGKIVAAGTTAVNGNADYAFARLGADGTPDATFGTGPVAGTTIIDTSTLGTYAGNDHSNWITVQPDGDLVACGVSDTDYWDHPGKMTAVRLRTDGSLDTGFGVGGVARVDQSSSANSCVISPDGLIYVAGANFTNSSTDLVVLRLTSQGIPDMTFGDSGVTSIDRGGNESVNGLVLLGDGKLGVTGRVSSIRENIFGSPTDMFVARLDPATGSLDHSFGNKGVTVIDFGNEAETPYSEGLGIVEQADGRLVVVGATNDGESSVIAVARVHENSGGNAGFVGWTYTSGAVAETSGQVTASVRRTGGGTGEISVDYVTVAGSAMTPADFSATSGTLVWLSGDMDPKLVLVPITSDLNAEHDENFTIVLTNSTSVLAASQFVATISESTVPGSPESTGAKVGGGGAINIMILILMAMISAMAKCRQWLSGFICRPAVRVANLLDTTPAKS